MYKGGNPGAQRIYNRSKERLITAVNNSEHKKTRRDRKLRKQGQRDNWENRNGKKNNYMDTSEDKLRALL